MSNYSSIKATINANIKQNNNEEITGVILNSVLNEMVDSLAAGYLFKGVATTSTNPGSPDEKVFYLGGAGNYSYFGQPTVTPGHLGVFWYDSSWHNAAIDVAPVIDIVNNLTEGGANKALSAEMGKVLAEEIDAILSKEKLAVSPATDTFAVGGGGSVQGWWPGESTQARLRGKKILKIRARFSTAGTFTVLKSSKVGVAVSSFSYDVVEQFTVSETGWQDLVLTNPLVLEENEWIGVLPSSDTSVTYYSVGGSVGMYYVQSSSWKASVNDIGFYFYVEDGYEQDVLIRSLNERIGLAKRFPQYSGLISNVSTGIVTAANATYDGYISRVEAGKTYVIDGFQPYVGTGTICIHCYSDYPVFGSAKYFLGEATYTQDGQARFTITTPADTKYLLVSGTKAVNVEGNFIIYQPGSIAGDLFGEIYSKDIYPPRGFVNGQVDVNTNIADDTSTADELQDAFTIGKDRFVLILPTDYKPYGNPTRLIIYGNPTGSYLNASSTGIPEGYPQTAVALADGYACLCCNGTPGTEGGQGSNGTPLNVLSIISAYSYAINTYNIARDGVFTCGYSQGSLVSFQVALTKAIPVLASVLIGADTDLWKIEYTGKNSTVRSSMITKFNFEEKEANSIVKALFPAYEQGGIVPAPTSYTSANSAPNSAEKAYILNNVDKWVAYNPMTCGMSYEDIAHIYSIWKGVTISEDATEAALYDTAHLPISTPMKLFVGTQDEWGICKFAKYFKKAVNNAGHMCELRVFQGLNHSQVARSTAAVTYTGKLAVVSARVTDVEAILFINRYNR